LRPGHELISKAWRGCTGLCRGGGQLLPIPAGFQVFSLSPLRKIADEGVTFRSHLDGSEHLLTPEKAVEIQLALGSDIAMVLDECIETPGAAGCCGSGGEADDFVGSEGARLFYGEDCAQRRFWRSAVAIRNCGRVRRLRTYGGRARGKLLEMDFPGYAVGGWQWASRTR